MVVVILFSGLVIALEAEHDCQGEECEICLCIEECILTLEQIDPDNASVYSANADAYIASLNDLDMRYEAAVYK